jgi:hypothetical protein
MAILPFLHEPEVLDIYGPFLWICPVISVFIAFLPALIYTLYKGANKVAAFIVVWYAIAFYFSQFPAVESLTGYNIDTDLWGFIFFGVFGFVFTGLFYAVLFKPNTAVQDLMYRWPASFLCAHQLYRLGGAFFLYLYAVKGLDAYFYLQAGIMDTFMGLSAIPMALYVGSKPLGQSRSVLLLWHAIGLFDLLSGFTFAIAEFVGLYQPEDSTAYIAYAPATLVCYFQGKNFETISRAVVA